MLRVLVTGVPVRPDREEARGLLAAELAGPEYREEPGSWALRAWTWLTERLSELEAPGLGTSWTAVLVVVLLLAAVAAAVLVVAGPPRRSGAVRAAGDVFAAGPEPSSAHARRADEAAAAGRWEVAVAERFRALARSLEERALLERRPGRTAHEVAEQAAAALPTCTEGLRRAARAFDDVRYGGHAASATTDADVRVVLEQVAAARPAPLTAAGPGAGT